MVFSSTASNWAAASLFILNRSLYVESDFGWYAIWEMIFELLHVLANCRCQLINAVKEPTIKSGFLNFNPTIKCLKGPNMRVALSLSEARW